MNEQDEKVRSDPDTKEASVHPETQINPSHREAAEIEGWALQWDTTALRKAALAKKMKQLRHAEVDQ